MSVEAFPCGEVAVVGAFESPLRKAPGVHPYAIQAECVRGALADAGLEFGDVEGFATAATFPPEGGWQMEIVELAEYVGLEPRWFDSTDTGGAAFITHAGHAAMAIAAGLIDVAVVSYGAAGRSSTIPVPDYNTNAWGPGAYEVPYGPSTIALYAIAAQRHMHEYGTTPEQLAEIAVQCRANAEGNPDARYRDPITAADVVASAELCSPLHLLDCCVVTDSGGAFVLASKRRAEQLSQKPVYLLGFGEALGQMQMNQMQDFTRTAAVRSGADALASAGMRPEEIDCAQLYDSFTITVLLTLESIGFCGPGEAGTFVEEGNLKPGGRLPINTDGGLIGNGEPIGASGLRQVHEIVLQLRGSAGERQVPNNPRVGYTQLYGAPGTAGVAILVR
jgi:acetyl-CoA C-acetyltransferase